MLSIKTIAEAPTEAIERDFAATVENMANIPMPAPRREQVARHVRHLVFELDYREGKFNVE